MAGCGGQSPGTGCRLRLLAPLLEGLMEVPGPPGVVLGGGPPDFTSRQPLA